MMNGERGRLYYPPRDSLGCMPARVHALRQPPKSSLRSPLLVPYRRRECPECPEDHRRLQRCHQSAGCAGRQDPCARRHGTFVAPHDWRMGGRLPLRAEYCEPWLEWALGIGQAPHFVSDLSDGPSPCAMSTAPANPPPCPQVRTYFMQPRLPLNPRMAGWATIQCVLIQVPLAAAQ